MPPSIGRAYLPLDDDLAARVPCAPLVNREVAVERERARLIGEEVDRDGFTRFRALHDAIGALASRNEAVRDVLSGKLDVDLIALGDTDDGLVRPRHAIAVFVRADAELALGLLRSGGARCAGQNESRS